MYTRAEHRLWFFCLVKSIVGLSVRPPRLSVDPHMIYFLSLRHAGDARRNPNVDGILPLPPSSQQNLDLCVQTAPGP